MFIGEENLTLYESYSRDDIGFGDISLPGIKINVDEYVLFANLYDQYDNRITEEGFIQEPRLEKHLLKEPQNDIYYLFIRLGDKGKYTYIGLSNSQKPFKYKYNLFEINTKSMPNNILKKLGGYQSLP